MQFKHLSAFCALLTLNFVVAQQEEKPTSYHTTVNSQTITFPNCPHTMAIYHDRIFVALPETIERDNAFAVWLPFSKKFVPLALAKATVNYDQEPQPNPIYNKTVSHIMMMNGRPTVACADYPALIYYDTYTTDEQKIITSDTLNDAAGKPTRGIIACSSGLTGNNWTLKENGDATKEADWAYKQLTYVVAAIKGSASEFGQKGSGLTLIKPLSYTVTHKEFDQEDEEEKEIKTERFRLKGLDSTRPTQFAPWNKEIEPEEVNKPFPVDPNSPVFSVNGGLSELRQNCVALHFDPGYERFYIGLQGTTKANATSNQGACMIATGRVVDSQLLVTPLVEHNYIGANSVIGATGADKEVNIHQLATLQTSTRLPYLIVVGGQGTVEHTKKHVWALPLYDQIKATQEEALTHVTSARDLALERAQHGTLAAKNSTSIDQYKSRTQTLHARSFDQAPASIADVPSMEDTHLLVGAGPLPGPAEKVLVKHDAVIAIVTHDAGRQYGVYRSLPVFDTTSAIVGWQAWQAIHISDEPIINYEFWSENGTSMLVTHDRTTHTCKLIESRWYGAVNCQEASSATKALITLIDTALPENEGGVQAVEEHDNLFIAVGNKKVVIAQPQTMNTRELDTGLCEDGSLEGLTSSVNALVCSGGALTELGPISCATVASDGRQKWLFVGGVFGVAQLMRPDGSGFASTEKTLFEQLDATMRFEKISDLQFVNKLQSMDHHLIVLNYQTVQAHNLQPKGRITTLVTALETEVTGFSDCFTHGSAIMIGTTRGLLYKDARSSKWQSLTRTGFTGSIYKIIPGASCVRNNESHQMIYILSGSIRKEFSSLHRLYIHTDANGNTTVELLPDFKEKDVYEGIMRVGQFRNQFSTDGTLTLTARSGNKKTPSALHILPGTWSAGNVSHGFGDFSSPVNVPVNAHISNVFRSTITGNWMITGSFGLNILEA